MATMVEATTRGQTSAPAAPVPWYRDQKRLIVGAAVAVLLLGVVAWVIISSERRKEDFAARSLNQARAAAEAGNLPLASSELQRLIDTYGGTDAATEAVITLNQVRLINGQGELAAVGLREFIDGDPPAKYLAPAYGLLGTALENSKRPGEAAEAYRNASKAADIEYLKARYLIDAGRAFRAAGKPAEAQGSYRAIIDSFPEASSVTEAKVRLAELTDGKM
jgi:tetratricopeptide (TPR) repeat protein